MVLPTVSVAAVAAGVAHAPEAGIALITSDGGGADNVTIADGTTAGQELKLIFAVEGAGGDTVFVTPANMLGGSTITLNAVGDGVVIVWTAAGWSVVANNGATLA